MKEELKKVVEKVIARRVPVEIAVPEQPAFGHYSTNVAMRLARDLKKAPIALAEELAREIYERAPRGLVEKIEASPPGFVNIWVTNEATQKELVRIAKEKEHYGRSAEGKRKTVIVEHSQPNIAKKMHVGHLRTTILGDALANVYEFLGYKVIRWNYLGDWGTQFGKLIAAYKLWGDERVVRQDPIRALNDLYVRFHDEMKASPELEGRGQEEFKKLEEGDRENKKLWMWFRRESLKEFDKTYRTLGVKFDTAIGESFFQEEMKPLVHELMRKGIARASEGSVIIPLNAFGLLPALIQKSDGASLYLTRDIANLRYRLEEYKPVKILYVVGNEQSLHFEQLFAVAKILGLDRAELVHVKYGLVLAEEGKKFATREGRVVHLEEVVAESIRLAEKIVQEKNTSLSEKRRAAVAHAVGVGALKYAILKENPHSDIVFQWEKMIDFSGDSAPYLQYTYARLMSIERRAGEKAVKAALARAEVKLLKKDIDSALIRKVADFPTVISACAKDALTNPLATYLYELANLVNRFYEAVPILADENLPRKGARFLLMGVVASVLERGLGLLGIKALDKI